MKAYNNFSYPIFEADQVLTQKQLNTIVSYLEEQDRLTRAGVIGVGSICGMEVTFPDFNSVTIACGTAITSLGFEINWQETTFDFYRDYELPTSFISPDIAPDEKFLKPIFDPAAKYSVFNDQPIKELVYVSPQDIANKKIPDGVQSIPSAAFYTDKVIMLLLEVSLIDIENCVATNCDDSGKKLEFKIKPLLVDAKIIPEAFKNTYLNTPLEAPLYLKRFGVPQTNLVTGQQILNAFYSMMNKELIDDINNAVNSVYQNFGKQYQDMVPNFIKLKDVGIKIREVIQAYRSSVAIQYVFSWLGDIIDAYNEIYNYEEEFSLKNCCSENLDNMFPFHVFLGRIKTQTLKNVYPGQLTPQLNFAKKGFFPSQYNILDTDQSYVTPWLKIAAGGQDGHKNIMAMLLERLGYIIEYFYIPDNFGNMEIKITPSKYGDYALSQKAIPYYYNEGIVPALNRVWNPAETIKKRNTSILGYYSGTYNSSAPVKLPLNYNIEKYNFLQVEGHIGQPYDQVVAKLNDIKNSFRLPMNIVALNAVDIIPGQLDMAKYRGDWGNLQLDYEIVSRRWEDTIGKCYEWFDHNPWVYINGYMYEGDYRVIMDLMRDAKRYTTKYINDFLPKYYTFVRIYEDLELFTVEIRQRLFNEISIVRYDEKGNPYTKRPFDAYSEETLDRLDEIINVRSLGQFRAIFQNAQEKWKTISQAITLKTFMDKNPGIQQANGSMRDGSTFIVIYVDKQGALDSLGQQKKKTVNPPVGILEYGNALKKYVNTVLDKSAVKIISDFADQYALTDSVRDSSAIPEKVVIADFFLPYILNGEGTPINFIVNPPNFTPGGDADFDKPDFSSPDMFAAVNPDIEL